MNPDIGLRTVFNVEAVLYHAIRPRYPEELFDVLVKTTQLRDNAKLLEIGPGQARQRNRLQNEGMRLSLLRLVRLLQS